jgi:hypothetical protein
LERFHYDSDEQRWRMLGCLVSTLPECVRDQGKLERERELRGCHKSTGFAVSHGDRVCAGDAPRFRGTLCCTRRHSNVRCARYKSWLVIDDHALHRSGWPQQIQISRYSASYCHGRINGEASIRLASSVNERNVSGSGRLDSTETDEHEPNADNRDVTDRQHGFRVAVCESCS